MMEIIFTASCLNAINPRQEARKKIRNLPVDLPGDDPGPLTRVEIDPAVHGTKTQGSTRTWDDLHQWQAFVWLADPDQIKMKTAPAVQKQLIVIFKKN